MTNTNTADATSDEKTAAKNNEARLVAAYRAQHPSSRVTSLLRNVGTGTSGQYECICCGAKSPTWSKKYRETKQVTTWCVEHKADHLADVEAALVALDAQVVGRNVEASAILKDGQS